MEVLGHKAIQLTQGAYAIVDEDLFEELNSFKWHLAKGGYAARTLWLNGKTKKVYMHRIINNTPENLFTDHINGNRLDNRKSNLRSCSFKENLRNRNIYDISSTGYKGVYKAKGRSKFTAKIKVDGKVVHIGQFDCPVEAAAAYNKKALECFGEFASINKL